MLTRTNISLNIIIYLKFFCSSSREFNIYFPWKIFCRKISMGIFSFPIILSAEPWKRVSSSLHFKKDEFLHFLLYFQIKIPQKFQHYLSLIKSNKLKIAYEIPLGKMKKIFKQISSNFKILSKTFSLKQIFIKLKFSRKNLSLNFRAHWCVINWFKKSLFEKLLKF